MYPSNVALREEVNKHAELDPDAREESSKCSPSDNLNVAWRWLFGSLSAG